MNGRVTTKINAILIDFNHYVYEAEIPGVQLEVYGIHREVWVKS